MARKTVKAECAICKKQFQPGKVDAYIVQRIAEFVGTTLDKTWIKGTGYKYHDTKEGELRVKLSGAKSFAICGDCMK